MSVMPDFSGLLVLPRLRVQNANAISAPLTWGFPSITAFLGLMWALERKISSEHALGFSGVGVVCHGFEPQVTSGGFSRAFHLTRNPVSKKSNISKDGSTKPDGIVEDGRAHLDLTLIFGVAGPAVLESAQERESIAADIMTQLGTMRIAGGSIVPAFSGRRYQPDLFPLEQAADKRQVQFRSLRRRWLPGFSLVSREDLLQQRLLQMQQDTPQATALDAWLDCSRLNWRAVQQQTAEQPEQTHTEWQHSRTNGWVVPIPVGYGAISALHPAGSVDNARDETTAFRFVEALYSLGQWIGPHHFDDVRQMLWYADHNSTTGVYRCCNDYSELTTTYTC